MNGINVKQRLGAHAGAEGPVSTPEEKKSQLFVILCIQCLFQNSSCDTNKWLIVDFMHQRHDFQLKMHHKTFGSRALPEPDG